MNHREILPFRPSPNGSAYGFKKADPERPPLQASNAGANFKQWAQLIFAGHHRRKGARELQSWQVLTTRYVLWKSVVDVMMSWQQTWTDPSTRQAHLPFTVPKFAFESLLKIT